MMQRLQSGCASELPSLPDISFALQLCLFGCALDLDITALQVLTLLNVKDISNKMCMQKRKPLLLLQARIFVVRSLLSDFLCQSQ